MIIAAGVAATPTAPCNLITAEREATSLVGIVTVPPWYAPFQRAFKRTSTVVEAPGGNVVAPRFGRAD